MHYSTIKDCMTTSYIFLEAFLLESQRTVRRNEEFQFKHRTEWDRVYVCVCTNMCDRIRGHEAALKITAPRLQSGSRAGWEFSSQLCGCWCFCQVKSVVLDKNTQPQTQAIVSQVLLLCFYEIAVQKEAHSLLWLLLFRNDCFAPICPTWSEGLPCFSLCVHHVFSK